MCVSGKYNGDESASGADLLSEGFSLLSDYIEVVDFNRIIYRLDYATGEAIG
jgi:hypothetical protein